MKKSILCIMLLTICILNGCGASKDIEYAQKELVKPDKMILHIDDGAKIITYEEEPERFDAIFEEINKNWWQYADSDEIVINDDEFIDVPSAEELRTTSDMRYMGEVQQALSFIYEEQTMKWTRSAVQEFEVTKLLFMIPKDGEEGKHVKSFYQVTTNYEAAPLEGIFAYYYSDEFYHVLSEIGQTVNSVYNDEPTDIGIGHFSEVTTDEMYELALNNTGWTRLKEENVYWNPLKKQVVINHVFSEKASEKQLEDARDYVKILELYRSSNINSETRRVWNYISRDADVIIQVYMENELISQDIYEDWENGFFYKETHYKK